jgi:hypothetical protein
MMRRTAIVLVCLGAATARAQTTVNRCQSDVEGGGGTNLARAVARGGRIVFDCPAASRIRMTRGHAVPPGTEIDGGDRVTLDGAGFEGTLFSLRGGSFSLQRITVRNGRPARGGAGRRRSSVIDTTGDLALDHVTIGSSESPVSVRGGGARIVGSAFLDNGGLAVFVDGSADVKESRFIANEGGLGLRAGSVQKTHFSENRAGGVQVFYPKGEVRIVASTFDRNRGRGAILLSQRSFQNEPGGVTIRRSTFTNNGHDFGGGAINVYDTTADAQPGPAAVFRTFGPARFLIAYCRFDGNRGRSGGAILADLANSGGMVVRGGIFSGNEGREGGGAIAWQGTGALVTHSLFKGNRTLNTGAALHARHPPAGASCSIANSLVVENVGGAEGAAVDVSSCSLVNVTIARNVGFGAAAAPGPQPVLSNAILSENSGGNCRGLSAAAFRGPNLQFGHSDCPGVAIQDPSLDELYVPDLGSAALFMGDPAVCRAAPVSGTDIVFQSRGLSERCALGAYERPPVRRYRPREPPATRDSIPSRAGERPQTESDASRVVLDALAREEQAPARRSDVALTRGGEESQYVIESLPGRLHLRSQGSIGEQEIYVIEGRVLQKDGGAWKESSAAEANPALSFLALIRHRLGDVTELEPATIAGAAHRRFQGSVAWPSSKGTSEGTLQFTIRADTNLPRRVTFNGTCDGVPCTFKQAIDYDAAITIEPPR